MSSLKVSVIVPLFNCKEYVLKCLESLYHQSVTDYEVIIINDGSTDGGDAIVEEFIEKMKVNNFRLISKENGGVSSARNRGIEEAIGEWIAFVDADDWVEPDYLQTMVESLKEYPADFCMTGFKKYFDRTGEIREAITPKLHYGKRDASLDKLFYPAPFARLYLRRIIILNHIRFDTRIQIGEDRAFNFSYLSHTQTCLIVPKQLYIYRINSNSATSKRVYPLQKKYLFEHVKEFWVSFSDVSVIENVFKRNHHIAHNIIDSMLADIVVTIIEKNKWAYRDIINNPIAIYIANNYKYKDAPFKEKMLTFLLKYRMHLFVRIIVKIYYSEWFTIAREQVKKGFIHKGY